MVKTGTFPIKAIFIGKDLAPAQPTISENAQYMNKQKERQSEVNPI